MEKKAKCFKKRKGGYFSSLISNSKEMFFENFKLNYDCLCLAAEKFHSYYDCSCKLHTLCLYYNRA